MPNVPDAAATTGVDAGRLDDARFAALMAPLGPFEARPGARGRDLGRARQPGAGPARRPLGARAARRGGRADRRPWAAPGIRRARPGRQRSAGRPPDRRQILTWTGAKPTAGIQAAARAARYRLLGNGAGRRACCICWSAHHLDDQAETVALRAARASGPDGLAGMAAVRELAGLRLLRPLLTLPKTALLGYLDALDQPWLDDPSNRAPEFARARLRGDGRARCGAARAAGGRARRRTGRMGGPGRRLARAACAGLSGRFRANGAGRVAAAPVEIARRAVQQTLRAVGGRPWPPRQARLARLLDELHSDRRPTGRTLGGCRLLRQGGRLLFCREAAAITEALELPVGRLAKLGRPLCGPSDRRGRGPLGPGARRRGWRQRVGLVAAGAGGRSARRGPARPACGLAVNRLLGRAGARSDRPRRAGPAGRRGALYRRNPWPARRLPPGRRRSAG